MDSTRTPDDVPEVLRFQSLHRSLPPASRRKVGPDLRHFPRLDVALEVSEESDSNFYMGLTENISEGGVFVATVHIRPVGSPIELVISLADGLEPLRVTGEVRWIRDCAPAGMGVRFTNLGELTRLRIRRFLLRRDALFYEE